MLTRPVLVLTALCVAAASSVAACSDDPAPSVVLDQNCREVEVSTPATAPDGPQFCGVGRYLSTEANTGEDQDTSADYVTMAFGWRSAKGFTFQVSGPPLVDNVFDVGSAVKLGITVDDASCAVTTDSPGFTTTGANGMCPVMQKVPANSGPLTFTVEVRKGDTVVDTLTVDIPFAAT